MQRAPVPALHDNHDVSMVPYGDDAAAGDVRLVAAPRAASVY
jgi:hypothetical protein